MAREIDDKKKRKALRKLRKAAERAEAEGGPGLSDWEKEFVEEVEARVEKFGSAFADPDKGNLDEPLSALQTRKLKEIDKKSRGKDTGLKQKPGFKSSFKPKAGQSFTPRGRDIHSDIEETEAVAVEDTLSIRPPVPPKGSKPRLIKAPALSLTQPQALQQAPIANPESSPQSGPPARKAPVFQVIKGGKDT